MTEHLLSLVFAGGTFFTLFLAWHALASSRVPVRVRVKKNDRAPRE